MLFAPEKITFFAKTDARGKNVPFGIKAEDRSKHMYIIGKTGMGKSTLLENMAIQDIQSGEGLAFIDPHGSTAEKLLEFVPEERIKDVLYFAPFDVDYPVSFNVMEDVGADKRHLVVSGLMSTFKKIWVDAWSARMEYILSNTLLALLEYPDSTLLGVNRMLSDQAYRETVVENVKDPSVKSFWVDEFAKYNERYMQEAGDAIKNKVGQFTANPLIRNIIGQPKSSFDLRQVMDEKKILIMNLSKGLIGETNANLLGSMLITRIYLSAMSRANLNASELSKMPNFYFYVDEFQSFANETFANILSEARKYKLNLIIAHQYIEQMEEEVRDAVFGNVGTTVAFRVGPLDAEFLETIFTPQFTATDLVNLGFAQIYLSLMIDGIGSRPFSAVTLPPIEQAPISYQDQIVAASRQQYAKPRAEVEAAINAWHIPLDRPVTAKTKQKKGQSSVKRTALHESQIEPPAASATILKNDEQEAPPERPADSGYRRPPARRPAPSVDELRNVLRSIVGEKRTLGASQEVVDSSDRRGGTVIQPEQHRYGGNSDKPSDTPRKEERARQPAAEKEHAKPNVGADLKSVLSDVLSHTRPPEQAAPAAATDDMPVTDAPPAADPPVEAEPAPVPSTSGGVSLKKIERMLRVTGADNPPFRP